MLQVLNGLKNGKRISGENVRGRKEKVGMNRVCEILNIKNRLFQGPMAGFHSTAGAAVSNAGGLGVLERWICTEPFYQRADCETRKLTDKPLSE